MVSILYSLKSRAYGMAVQSIFGDGFGSPGLHVQMFSDVHRRFQSGVEPPHSKLVDGSCEVLQPDESGANPCQAKNPARVTQFMRSTRCGYFAVGTW